MCQFSPSLLTNAQPEALNDITFVNFGLIKLSPFSFMYPHSPSLQIAAYPLLNDRASSYCGLITFLPSVVQKPHTPFFYMLNIHFRIL